MYSPSLKVGKSGEFIKYWGKLFHNLIAYRKRSRHMHSLYRVVVVTSQYNLSLLS